MKKKMVKVGSGDIWVNAANVSFIEDDVVVMSNKHRYKASEEALGVIKAEMAASELRKAEIIEVVCKLYADGFTGNKIIKAIGNAVTYNTDAVAEGDIYCVSYRDGGFYVGLRTTEDYEPKEGDWWCYFTVTKTIKYNTDSSGNGYVDFLRGEDIGLFLDTAYNPNEYRWYFTFLKDGVIVNTYNLVGNSEFYFLTVDANNSYSLANANSYQGKLLKYPLPSTNILNNKSLIGYTNNSTTYNNKGTVFRKLGTTNITEKVSILLWKPITTSDILAYQATGHMGWLMFGEELEISGNTSYNANKQFLIKNNVKYAVAYYDADNNQVEVDFATQNIHGAKCTMYNNNDNIYNIYATEKIGTDNNVIYIYQLDFESHYQDGVMERYITSEKRTEGEAGAYHHIKVFPVLQDNRPATLNALNTNLLNSNQTDVQPINDETDG